MGNLNTYFSNKHEQKKIFVTGLDAAGKTTLVYSLGCDSSNTSLPSSGFYIDNCIYKHIIMDICDLGGRSDRLLFHMLKKVYLPVTHGLIFVVDSNDHDRMPEMKEAFDKLIFSMKELRNSNEPLCPILILANKQDLPNALTTSEITERLGLMNERSLDKWYVQPTCLSQKTGIHEGLEWLLAQLDQ
jgi:small GTP-binding protein